MHLDTGLIHIYTGNGKGKTTVAIGLGIRACGHGLQVILIQFMKGRRYSEIIVLEKIEHFTVKQFGRDEFVSKQKPAQIDIDYAQQGLRYAQKIITQGKYDLVILDEINVALDYGLITLKDVSSLLTKKPAQVEIVLTGRYAPPELMKLADVVSEINEIKHPFKRGVLSRKGIDW